MNAANFIEEVKASISGKWLKPKTKKKNRRTAEEICKEVLYE